MKRKWKLEKRVNFWNFQGSMNLEEKVKLKSYVGKCMDVHVPKKKSTHNTLHNRNAQAPLNNAGFTHNITKTSR